MSSVFSALSDLVRAADKQFRVRKAYYLVQHDSRVVYFVDLYSTALVIVGLTCVFVFLLGPVWAAGDLDDFLEARLQ